MKGSKWVVYQVRHSNSSINGIWVFTFIHHFSTFDYLESQTEENDRAILQHLLVL